MNPQEEIVWSAPEYTHRKRGVDWFWGLGVVVLCGAILAVYFDNPLFAIVILLSGLTLVLFSTRQPQEIEYALSPRGVRSGDTLYPFSTLQSFWVTEENKHEEKIILISKKVLMMHIVIPVEGHSADEIRNYLSKYLPAVEHHEPFIYELAERLGF